MRRSRRLDIAFILLLCLMGRVHGNDSSSPAGTWYLSADGQRLALNIQHHGGNTWGGSIQVEGTPGMSEVINHLEWYPGTRRIVIRTYTATGLWRWHRGHIVEGVIKGRSSDPDTSPMQPAVSGFTRHFTGWNAHHIDQQLTPRTFELQIGGDFLARLRIDESAPGSGLHIGQMKVYASQSQGAFDEGQADRHNRTNQIECDQHPLAQPCRDQRS